VGLGRRVVESSEFSQHANLWMLRCDVSQNEQVFEVVNKVVSAWGRIDLVIANAGISEASPSDQPFSSVYEAVLNTNVIGAVYLFDAVIPTLMKQKCGHLVSISSLAAYRGLPQAGAYSASKAALTALTESMRIDLKPYSIDVSVIHPGWIDTPLTRRNAYPMPFKLSLDEGVDRIVNAIEQKKDWVSFPWPLVLAVNLLKIFPAWLYDSLIGKRKNKKRSSL